MSQNANHPRRSRAFLLQVLTAVLWLSRPAVPAAPAESQPLVFLGDKDYPPVAYLDRGVARGMDVDLARAIGAKLNRPVKVELMDWAEAQEKVLRGEADALLSLSITDDRRAIFDFATPTFTREFGLVIRRGDLAVRGIEDLEGKRVGVTPGGFPRLFLKSSPSVHMHSISNYQEGLDRLMRGELDALAADLWVAAHFIEENRVQGATLVGKPFATTEGAIAVKKGNTAMLRQINEAVAALIADGTIDRIRNHWRPEEMILVSRQRVWTILANAIGIVLGIVFIGMVLWVITLKRQIHNRRRAEALTELQRQVMEMIARGRPLHETLNALLKVIEAQSSDMVCSILLLDPDGVHVRRGAGPSLPKEYLDALDGREIGPRAGSCGTAAFRREPVFVSDITTDPLWTECRKLAEPLGLRACWSTPIFDSHGRVLGTFAIYYRKTGLPKETHLRLIEVATYTAAICISKHRMDEALHDSEESLRATIQNTPYVAVQWFNADGRVLFWNPASEIMFGWSAQEAVGKTLDQLIHTPEQARHFVSLLAEIQRTGKPSGPNEFQFRRRDGAQRTCLSTVFRIPFAAGQYCFVCMDVDVTERKHAEESLRQAQERELRSREEFARHLMTAQELERKRLASELHDSLGQNLSLIKNRAHLARQMREIPPAAGNHLDAIERLVSDSISETRNLAHNLRPLHIEQLGLTDALQGLIRDVSQSTGIHFERRVENVDDVFKGDAATNVYRILQETLNNLVKHSGAQQAIITVERDIRSVRLRVADDGRGFNLSKEPFDGLGLTSITERARMLGGDISIQSEPRKGTAVTVELPVPESN